MKTLYKFQCDIHRSSDLEGLFIEDDSVVNCLMNSDFDE